MSASTLFVRMLSFTFIGLLFTATAYADDYKEFSKQLRKEIWEWQKPEFQRHDVPEQYKNESAVILALYEELIATGNSKMRFDPNTFFALNKELNYSSTSRKMIYINDKTALEKNSEISYVQQQRSFGYRVSSKGRTVIGVRIIKPDGTIGEVDMDEAVSVKEQEKLAIPDLQVGDILDYFVYMEGRVDYMNIAPQNFFLLSPYPILSYSIHCEINKNLTAEYRSINGAPDFTESVDPESNIILDISKTGLPKISASNWVSSFRQLPVVRLAIYFNTNKKIFKPGSYREKGLHKNVPSDAILHDAMGYFAGSNYYLYITQAGKSAKKYFKKHPGMNDAAKADYLNMTLMMCLFRFGNSPHPVIYMRSLHMLLDMFKIEHQVGFVTDRFDARYEEVSHYSDFYPLITVDNNKQFLLPPHVFFHHNYRQSPEGETIHTVKVKKMNSQSKEGIKGVYGQTVYPVPLFGDNMNKTVQQVNFSNESLLTLNVGKEETYTGKSRNGRYPQQILFTEKTDAVLRYLGEPAELETLKKKGKQRDIDAYQAMIEKKVKERNELIKETLADEYTAEIKEVSGYSYPKLGVTPNEQEIVFNVNFTVDGLVKRAGNNYILDVGKMIGNQIVIDDEQRNRSIDAYLSAAHSYRNEIKITIPEGYAVEGWDKLNRNVDNEYGRFQVSVASDSNEVKLTIEKIYKQHHVPTADWSKLVAMLDACNAFYAQSLIFRKVN